MFSLSGSFDLTGLPSRQGTGLKGNKNMTINTKQKSSQDSAMFIYHSNRHKLYLNEDMQDNLTTLSY